MQNLNLRILRILVLLAISSLFAVSAASYIPTISFNFSIDKDTYSVGETVYMKITPKDAKHSIVVVDDNDIIVVVDDFEFKPSAPGNYEINALVYNTDLSGFEGPAP